MEHKTFRVALMLKNGGFLRVSGNGVAVDPNPYYLDECIDNWQDISVTISRVMDNWGVFKEYSLDVRFVQDAYTILKWVHLNMSIYKGVVLVVEKLNTQSGDYYLWYEGDINTKTIVSNDTHVTANITDERQTRYLRNRDSINYTVDVGNDASNLILDGVKLRSNAFFILGNTSRYDNTPSSQSWFTYGSNVSVPQMQFLPNMIFGSQNVVAGQFLIPKEQEGISASGLLVGAPSTLPYPRIDWIYRVTRYSPFTITTEDWTNVVFNGFIDITSIVGESSSALPFRLEAWLVAVAYDTPSPTPPFVYQKQRIGVSNTYTSGNWQNTPMNVSGTINSISKNSSLYIVLTCVLDNNTGNSTVYTIRTQMWSDTSILRFNYLAKARKTAAKGYRYIDFIKKMVAKMTDNTYDVESNFLSNASMSNGDRTLNFNSKPYNVMVTSGMSLRNIPKQRIVSNYSNVLKDLFSLYNIIPTYIFNTIKLEPMKDILVNVEALKIESINGLQISSFNEITFNEVKIGQPVVDNKVEEGLQEFNTTLSFVVKEEENNKGVLDLVSPFRRDMYGIESVRVDSFSEDKMDVNGDSDIFLIEVENTQVYDTDLQGWGYKPYRPIGIITGVDDPSGAYNITLSPKRSLLRNTGYIRSMIDYGNLEFVSTLKNPSLVSNINVPYNISMTISEVANINLYSNLYNGLIPVEKLFLPYVFEFECAPPYDLQEIISGNLNGYVSFLYNNKWFKGYILEVGCIPATRDVYTFRLLSHKDNNLQNLI